MIGLLAVIAAVVGGYAWMRPRSEPPGQRPVVMVVSGDTAGWIVPCGCTANQSGGLLRRGSFIRGLKDGADVIAADVGGAVHGTSPYQQVKLEAILRGEAAMGYEAHNIGGPEAALGGDYLKRISANVGVPFVSANARGADGSSLTEPIRIVERGGRRVGLIGVLSRQYASPDVQVDDPKTAVLRTVTEAKGRCDSFIVLAYAPDDELRKLATELPEVDAVIGGPTGQAIAPQRVGPNLLASATNKGKFLVQLDAEPNARQWSGQIVEMDPKWPDDPEQQTNLRNYLSELERRDFVASETGFSPMAVSDAPAGYRIAGNQACQSCHANDCALLSNSKHAAAWKSLLDRGYHVDPYCQQCHTTGYGLPDGFVSRTRSKSLESVGCENCHGPSQAHVRDPKVRTMFLAKDQCISCHDHENSPHFAYEAYWAKIRHGMKAGVSP